ncbi:MAG: DciA family protein [Rhizobiaceae bacterium]|jgi:hypothetical protein|nr:DciA family protein [Rhizobiaceae bacterium]
MADSRANFKPRAKGVPAQALADIVPDLLDPVLQRRAGLTTALIAAWGEIAGGAFSGRTVPSRTIWGRADAALDGSGAAILVVAADPAVALAVQHETDALLARVNGFFGYRAIDRIKVERKSVRPVTARPRPAAPGPDDHAAAARMVEAVGDEALRASLQRLGANVIARRRRSSP